MCEEKLPSGLIVSCCVKSKRNLRFFKMDLLLLKLKKNMFFFFLKGKNMVKIKERGIDDKEEGER